jgi:hypothetical protein
MAVNPVDLAQIAAQGPLARQALTAAAQQYQNSPGFQPIQDAAPAQLVDNQQNVAAPAPLPTVHDVTVATTRKVGCARVMGVPPEEFGIERGARDTQNCNYFFHDVVTKTAAQLIAEGYDANQIAGITDYTGLSEIETIERDTVDEHLSTVAGGVQNDSARLVKITEHYIRMDYEGTGRPCLYLVITGGDQGEVLRKDGKDCITPFDAIPFATTTPVPQTHRFFGRSLADLIMPIQREKTALKRGALDNLYLRVNPRVEVAEANAGPNTLDDLLVSRPGGVVRTKTAGGINWQEVPDVSGSVYPMMQYLDSNIESRTGISKQTQGLDANALQNQSATAVAQVFNASQMRMKLIARIMAEGVRDVFSLLHATIRKHGSEAQTVRLRNQWVTVDPREWKTRDHMTINVGLGTGGKAQQFAQTMAIANVQKEMVGAGMTNIVGQTELYNTACELTKIMGHKNANKFFKDPDAKDPRTGQLLNPPPPAKPDPKTQAIQAQSAATMQEQQQRSQLSQQETQLEAQLKQFEAEVNAKLKLLDAALDARSKQHDANLMAQSAEQTARHANARHRLDVTKDLVGIAATAHAHDVNTTQNREAHAARMQQDQNNNQGQTPQ